MADNLADLEALTASAQMGEEWAIQELEEAPKLKWPFHWNAFNDLGTERQIGMSMGPIPLSKVEWYGAKLGMTGRELEVFERIIRRVDIHYMNQQAARASARIKSAK